MRPTAALTGDSFEDSSTDLLIEGTTAEEVHTDSVVQSPVNLRWMIAGGLALVLLLFGLTQWPKGDQSSPEAGAAAAEAAEDDEEASDDGAEPDDDVSEEPDDVESPTTTERDDQADGSVTAGNDAEDGDESEDGDGSTQETGPLLGEPTGLGVIYGSQGFGKLKLLELDTRIVHELEATGDPIGIVGSSLVTRRSESLSVFPLSSIDAEPTRINGQNGWVDVVSLSDDRIWTISGDPIDDGWVVVGHDQNGVEAESVEFSASFPFYGWNPSSEFVQGEAGGIYRRDGAGFQRVNIGSLVTAGEELVLARECDEALNCGLNWYANDRWDSPLDLPVPDLPVQGQVTVTSQDRWLIVTNWINGKVELYDVQTGEMVREITSVGNGPIQNTVGLSPDGRWLIDSGFGDTLIVDLDTGAEWPLEVRSEVALFVDLSVVDFAG